MGKIHSHYDNLKVSRGAPQEVVRAAYKALTQKYHPDKNPGDEKAARIMAIINTAYGTLSDPHKRKEHDEWIAAEEWEIAWLESTRGDDGRAGRQDAPAHAWPEHVAEPRAAKSAFKRNWKWGVAVSLALLGGWVGGVLSAGQPRLQAVLAAALGGGSALGTASAEAGSRPAAAAALKAKVEEVKDPLADSWALPKAQLTETSAAQAPAIKVLALSQVVLPGAAAAPSAQDCDSAPPSLLVAPNGEPWPARSGYVEGFPVGNKGEDMQLTLDNANNPSAVFIKVYDLDRKANVRYAFVQARDTLVVDKLAMGRYEIRYQNLDAGDRSACRQGRL